ncbi:MAG: NADH-quinone oxidoreductase subunit H, partial [Deltaproteobacteria bacterium]|nr:NADH-quinone oxidoreductase subunit H [Deltaproteobacteria bacterium]
MDWAAIIKPIIILVAILNFIPLMIWFERKGSAYIQDRRGPNRAAILGIRMGGMLHNIADVLKLLTKEDIVPTQAHRFFYFLAPILAMFVASVTVGVIPFAAPLAIGERMTISFQVADLNVGILYVLAMGSLGVYGVLLAGWSANNNYTLLGGLRASAQMVSYEIAMALALVAVILAAGSVRIGEIIDMQRGGVWMWNIVMQPVAFVIFLTALFAETNRNPFDLPEGESELVAGYHTEYSSM